MKDELLKEFNSVRVIELNQIKGGMTVLSSCKIKHNMQDTTHEIDYDDGKKTSSPDHTWFGDVMDVISFWD